MTASCLDTRLTRWDGELIEVRCQLASGHPFDHEDRETARILGLNDGSVAGFIWPQLPEVRLLLRTAPVPSQVTALDSAASIIAGTPGGAVTR